MDFRGALGHTPHFISAYFRKSTGLGIRTTEVEFWLCYQLVIKDGQIVLLWMQSLIIK